MEILGAFADIEDIVLEMLASVGSTVLATPDVITPPLVVVRRTGGFDDQITDTPRVQVECFGYTRRQTADMAEACRQIILAAPGTGYARTSIDATWTEAAPSYVNYGDRNIQRYVGTYRISLRRPR